MRPPLALLSHLVMPAFAVFVLSACVVAQPAHALPFIGGGGGKVTVTISAASDCNNCGSGTASALKIRVFMVTDEAAIRTVLNNKGVGWSKQIESAGATVVGEPSENFVAPGATKVFVVAKDCVGVTQVGWHKTTPKQRRSHALHGRVDPRHSRAQGHARCGPRRVVGVETKRLNEAVRRNPSRFPAAFMFQITPEEAESLRAQSATSNSGRGGRRHLP